MIEGRTACRYSVSFRASRPSTGLWVPNVQSHRSCAEAALARFLQKAEREERLGAEGERLVA